MMSRSLRAKVRVGAAARRRIQGGGSRALGRPAATREEWATIRRVIFRRARWRCQACGRWGAIEVHHVVKRAQGGSDFDLDRPGAPTIRRSCPPSPQATARCVMGAMERALSELVNLNVYALLGLEVDGYDTAPCRAVQKTHDELRNARRGIGTARRDRMNQKSMRS